VRASPPASIFCGAFCRDRVHQEVTRAVEQNRDGAEGLLHAVLGDGSPDVSGAVVETKRIVDGCDEMEAIADDRDDLAIAGIAHALYDIPLDDQPGCLSLGARAGGNENKTGKSARPNKGHHHGDRSHKTASPELLLCLAQALRQPGPNAPAPPAVRGAQHAAHIHKAVDRAFAALVFDRHTRRGQCLGVLCALVA
jgi:hypothetical protein